MGPKDASPHLSDVPEAWPVVGSEDLYRGGAPFSVRSDRLHHPDDPDEEFARVVVEHPGAAVVLALDDQDRALVVLQYRHAVQHRMVELPAGLLDKPGEDPEDAARRELVEETGYEASEWTHLVTTYASPGISAEIAHISLARGLTRVGRGDFEPQHEEALMRTGWVPFGDLHAAVLRGDVQDAPVVIAVLAAQARGLMSP